MVHEMKLNKIQKMALMHGLPSNKQTQIFKICEMCKMKGTGVKDIVNKVKKLLGKLGNLVGPTIIKEFIMPHLKVGRGLNLAGGRGLKLAGQGLKKKKKKGLQKNCKKRRDYV